MLTYTSEPPWVLIPSDAPAVAENVLQMDMTAGGRVLPAFLSVEVMARFVQDIGRGGLTGSQLGNVGAFLDLLDHLKANGTTHVNFNADYHNPNPVPIGDVIAFLRGQTN